MSGFAAWYYGYGFMCFVALIFIWALIALTFIDFDTQLLPDAITLPLLWIGLLINLNNGIVDLQSAVIGAVAGYLVLWVVYWFLNWLLVKKEWVMVILNYLPRLALGLGGRRYLLLFYPHRLLVV